MIVNICMRRLGNRASPRPRNSKSLSQVWQAHKVLGDVSGKVPEKFKGGSEGGSFGGGPRRRPREGPMKASQTMLAFQFLTFLIIFGRRLCRNRRWRDSPQHRSAAHPRGGARH